METITRTEICNLRAALRKRYAHNERVYSETRLVWDNKRARGLWEALRNIMRCENNLIEDRGGAQFGYYTGPEIAVNAQDMRTIEHARKLISERIS